MKHTPDQPMASSLPSITAVVPTFLSSMPIISNPAASRLPLPKYRPHPSLIKILPRAFPSPIFLPHLEKAQDVEEEEDEEGKEREDDPDPIRDFFESRTSQFPDPEQEGRITFQRNRKTSWKLANMTLPPQESTSNEDESEDLEEVGLDGGCQVLPVLDDGIVGEVLQIARNLPENSTIGEFLGTYAGRIEEGDCIELLRKMGEEGLALCCLYLFEWMGQQKPSLVTPRSCSVLFPILGKAGMGEKLMVLFDNLPRAKRFRAVPVYNSAISGLSFCKRYDDAWKVYVTMEANNILPDHVTCSSLITIMRKSDRSAKEAWEFFERMGRKGVKLRLETYGAIIKSFCAEGMKKEALVIQSEMERNGIASNTIIYNTLMDAYVKSNQVEEAEGLFNEMKEKGLKSTPATYNILMDAYSKRMQPEVVESLLVEMENSGLRANVKSYTCLISAYGRQKSMNEMAENAFLRMKKAGIKPTSHSYTALIHAYSVRGWQEKALITFEDMKRAGISPSIENYTALLDAFRRKGDTQKLMEIWKSMANDKIEGTRVTFNILLDGLSKQGLYVQARDVIHEFVKLGMQPTVMTYNMLMNAYARGGQHNKLPQLLKEMAALNLKPDSFTYSTIIYAYIRVRDFKRAFYYHKDMIKSGQVPDGKSYQKLRKILDAKAATKNKRDRGATVGIVNSKMGLVRRKGKKDEFWKYRKGRSS